MSARQAPQWTCSAQKWGGARGAPNLQSMSSAWFLCPSRAMSWSIMPQGTPAKLCSARWHTWARAAIVPESVAQGEMGRRGPKGQVDSRPLRKPQQEKKPTTGELREGRLGGSRALGGTWAELLQEGVRGHFQGGRAGQPTPQRH